MSVLLGALAGMVIAVGCSVAVLGALWVCGRVASAADAWVGERFGWWDNEPVYAVLLVAALVGAAVGSCVVAFPDKVSEKVSHPPAHRAPKSPSPIVSATQRDAESERTMSELRIACRLNTGLSGSAGPQPLMLWEAARRLWLTEREARGLLATHRVFPRDRGYAFGKYDAGQVEQLAALRRARGEQL